MRRRATTASCSCRLLTAIVIVLSALLLCAFLLHRWLMLNSGVGEVDAHGQRYDDVQWREIEALKYSLSNRHDPFTDHHQDDDQLLRLHGADLKLRVDDLNRMRLSVLAEMRTLEVKRHQLKQDIDEHNRHIEKLQTDIGQKTNQLSALQKSIDQSLIEQRDAAERNRPPVDLPMPIYPPKNSNSKFENQPISEQPATAGCTMSKCFNWQRCSITTSAPVYFYDARNSLAGIFANLSLISTTDPDKACLFVHVVRTATQASEFQPNLLQHWGLNGQNHVIVAFSALPKQLDLGAALLATADFTETLGFRPKFDLVIPQRDAWLQNDVPKWTQFTPLLPLHREFLLTFTCTAVQFASIERELGQNLTSVLRALQSHTKIQDKFHLDLNSDSDSERSTYLKRSMFVLAICTFDETSFCQTTVLKALRYGAIPVLIGSDQAIINRNLPFAADQLIDWQRATLMFHAQRISELHFVLRSMDRADLLEMRRFGRLVLQRYLADENAILDTILSTLRTRLMIPPPAHQRHPDVQGVFPGSDQDRLQPKRTTDVPNVISEMEDEYLGAVERPYTSPSYQHNFTRLFLQQHYVWNVLFEPHVNYPSLPVDSQVLPSEAQFHSDTRFGFRSIGDGLGGSGREFSDSLGGNVPREQFTVVILTYEREMVLSGTLAALNRLPYLNKVIVMWNSPNSPSDDIVWPRLHVPVVFVRPTQTGNSLNNRFLPVSYIETDAVLSLDDDVRLTHAEIILAFRIWRESRDHIVGFPARYHAWDGADWLYNSNHTCQLSMVLTGAAFFHRTYMYLYTYRMPESIRAKVDELMNCEDLAFNFLVSHYTRKPPIKVTSKWTFRCPGCPDTPLSSDDSHFIERHSCVQYFTHVYGYNPLLYTQIRVDSVLFKTRIPTHHQKCFKYI